MAKFKIGDSVRVEGGPLMTVKAHDKAGRAVCSWYVTGEGWQQKAFAEADLQKRNRGRRPNTPPAVTPKSVAAEPPKRGPGRPRKAAGR